jgi:glycosyltransferase involved in cell wall biosynthesis
MTKKLSVLIISSQIGGGAELSTKRVHRLLSSRLKNARIDLITRNRESNFQYLLEILRLSRRKKIIISTGRTADIIASTVTKIIRAQHIAVIRDNPNDPAYQKTKKDKIYNLLWKSCVKKSNVISISNYILNECKIAFPRSLGNTLIYNSLIDKKPTTKPKEGKPILWGCGRLSPEKRPAFWLRTAEHLLMKGTIKKAIWIGDGEMLNELHNLSTNRPIYFRGSQNDPSKNYRIGDIFLSTRLDEGFGNVALEAMRRGCLTCVPDSGGSKEIVNCKKNGLIYKNAIAPDKLAKEIIEKQENSNMADIYINAIRRSFNFIPQKEIKCYLNLICKARQKQ